MQYSWKKIQVVLLGRNMRANKIIKCNKLYQTISNKILDLNTQLLQIKKTKYKRSNYTNIAKNLKTRSKKQITKLMGFSRNMRVNINLYTILEITDGWVRYNFSFCHVF